MMIVRAENTATLQLLRLASQALPIGAYSYSQGLEYACDSGWISRGEEAGDWLTGVLLEGMACLDLPVIQRMHRAWDGDDIEAALSWSRYLLACRESSELRHEERETGHALARLLCNLDIEGAESCLLDDSPSLALSFSLAAQSWNIPVRQMACAYLWSWSENQVAAAIKLIPIGQTEGQKILSRLIPVIDSCVEAGLKKQDDEIFGSLPGLVTGSALHENQYSRMFQS